MKITCGLVCVLFIQTFWLDLETIGVEEAESENNAERQ